MSNITKIAIVKLSSIGDIAHTAFIPALIKKHIQNCEIHWFCDEAFTDILKSNPWIDGIIPMISKNAKRKPLDFLRQLFKKQKYKFDYVLDFQGTFKSALIARAISSNNELWGLRFTRDIIANKLYTKHCLSPLSSNVYQRAIDLINTALKIKASRSDIKTPFLYTEGSVEKQTGDILVFPSSSKAEKNLSPEKWIELIKQMDGYKTTLMYGNSLEKELCGNIAKDFKNVDVIGGLSLSEVKTVIAKHKCVIGGDTGILHIASGLGVKNITLYGPTPKYRTSINQNHSIALQGNGNVNMIPISEIIKALSFLKI